VKIFWWFEKEMNEREVDTIPATDSDYKIKWAVTPEEIMGRYVSLERYVPEKDRRR